MQHRVFKIEGTLLDGGAVKLEFTGHPETERTVTIIPPEHVLTLRHLIKDVMFWTSDVGLVDQINSEHEGLRYKRGDWTKV